MIGVVDAFDKQSEIDNKRFSHEKYKIGQRAAILPSLGRVPDLPTFQQPAAVTRPSNSLAMDITSSLIDGVVTAVAVNPAKTGFKPRSFKPATGNISTPLAGQTGFGYDSSITPPSFGTGSFSFGGG